MDMSRLETQQISIRMPKYLVQAIDRERQSYQVSRSKAIIAVLQIKLLIFYILGKC
ncbi:hypothetical protein MNB_SUP05-SYMBIONT-5-506 [hydrothermal vent metagenome]|uniref:Uncharacterized protein n=1 Tax=hydrothermal vent metagenome TaxID=652676 RepID=A0A1W1E2W5_9ZZZZ